jgi:glycosyltransferase involved in cell wall biosynthesis
MTMKARTAMKTTPAMRMAGDSTQATGSSGGWAWGGAWGVAGVHGAATGANLSSPLHLDTVGPLRAHRLSVVVPMYNEADNAVPLLDAISTALADYPQPWELIVVDDGSRDATATILRHRARALGAHIRVIALARNFRQTAAMQAGIDAAHGDVIVTMDGDLQNDPRDIPRLVRRLLDEDLDIVAGWRHQRQDGFWLRRLPSQLANRLIRRITGLPFHDLGCSLKAFRADVLREVRLYGEMHRFIPAWLSTVTSPARMAEEPVAHHPRTRGASKYGLSRTLRVLVDLLAVTFFQRFAARPGHFFGVIGLAVLGVGLAILGYLGALKLVLGEEIGGRPLLSLGFFCTIGGLQFLTTGVLAELLIRIYYGARHGQPYVVRPERDDD